MAARAAWRFCSDLACAFFRHCSVRVCLTVVDTSIPKALLFDGLDHFLRMGQLLLLFLPRSRVGWIRAECFDRNEQIGSLALPHGQVPLVRAQLWTGRA